jgi:hypothetical protein
MLIKKDYVTDRGDMTRSEGEMECEEEELNTVLKRDNVC